MRKEGLVGEQGCTESEEQEESRDDGDHGETKLESVTWTTSVEKNEDQKRGSCHTCVEIETN